MRETQTQQGGNKILYLKIVLCPPPRDCCDTRAHTLTYKQHQRFLNSLNLYNLWPLLPIKAKQTKESIICSGDALQLKRLRAPEKMPSYPLRKLPPRKPKHLPIVHTFSIALEATFKYRKQQWLVLSSDNGTGSWLSQPRTQVRLALATMCEKFGMGQHYHWHIQSSLWFQDILYIPQIYT